MAEELSALAADLRNASTQIRQKASQVVRKSALALRDHARQHAPVDTGFMQSSISMRSSRNGLDALISPQANYAHFVEHGTIYMMAQPFMEPAENAIRPSFEQAMAQVGRELL